jgi:hypothetical protein
MYFKNLFLLLFLFSCLSPARKWGDNTIKARIYLLEKIPPGTETAKAEKEMKSLGFHCQSMINEFFITEAERRNFIYCDYEYTTPGLVSRRWQAAIFYENEKVKDIKLTKGLTGL